MINPPDELLEDLQTNFPPPAKAQSPTPLSDRAVNGHTSPGHDHLESHYYDKFEGEEHLRGYIPPPTGQKQQDSRAGMPQQFEAVQYSEVRKGPFYVPKSQTESSPPPPKPPQAAPSAGLAELDSLLELLNDTQQSIQDQEKQPPALQEYGSRPSVANLVDELTEVEQQVSDKTPQKSPSRAGSTQRSNITASTATIELDELMANLSNFEPPPTSEVSYAKPNKGAQKQKSAVDDLNSMLGSLQMDMTQRGVDTAVKGVCAACSKPILAKVVNALGRQWHLEHFTCTSCDMELIHSTYYESNGRPYCEKDYHELYAPRCAYCNGPILDRVMRALDKTWHPEHFFCTLCGKHFGPEGFHEKDSKAFCRECYYEKFAPHCKRCEKAIMEGFITALNAQWHPECFSCKVCEMTFPRGNYFEHEGEPHCEIHYHASKGTLCASCQKPVTGKCITAMGRKWHPEHFQCAFCLKMLNKGTFKEHRHNPYCQPCYIKLFGYRT